MPVAAKMRKHPCWPLIEKTLEAHGIDDWAVFQTGRHPIIRFVYHGMLIRYPLPHSTRGAGTRMNVVSNLRRKLKNMDADKKLSPTP